MKYLYVLVSGKSDYYSEQAYLSIYSLRQHTPNCFVSLLVDVQTSEYLKNNFIELINSVNECKVVDLGNKYSNKEKSRILKTTMRQHIEDDFLFIDCDTIICEDLTEIKKYEYNIGCVLDSHVPVIKHWAKDWMKKNDKKCGFKEAFNRTMHFNSGVIYCKDNDATRKFYMDWANFMEQSIKAGVNIDQPSFNQADSLNGELIGELEGKWNCQIIQGGIKHLHNAKIIHYFASNKKFKNPYLLADKIILEEIRINKKLSNNCLSLLSNPRTAIDENAALLSPDVPIKLLYHEPFRELVYICKNHQILYKTLRIMYMIFSKLHK